MERGVRRADGATPRKPAEQPQERQRSSSKALRALEGSSALGRVPQPFQGQSLAIAEVLRDVSREILALEALGKPKDLAETIRARFLPGLAPEDLERALSRRGQPALHALAYVAALTQTRTAKPVRSAERLFLKVAWRTGQDPALQLAEILAARRRLTAPPTQSVPASTGRSGTSDRAAAAAWLTSLPSPERTSLRETHRITGNPYDRLEDWPVRAWRTAGKPEPLGADMKNAADGESEQTVALYASRMSICALRTSLCGANAMCCWLMWVSPSYWKV